MLKAAFEDTGQHLPPPLLVLALEEDVKLGLARDGRKGEVDVPSVASRLGGNRSDRPPAGALARFRLDEPDPLPWWRR